MSKQPRKTKRESRSAHGDSRHVHREQLPAFLPRTLAQETLYKQASTCPMVIAEGSAGTGKSYTLVRVALDLYFRGCIETIVLTRPPEPVGSTLGLFKGDLAEKMANWLAPVFSQFVKVLNELGGNGASHFENLKSSVIRMQPLETLKGSSFDRTFVLVEEAQDADLESLRVVSTRIGEGSVLALNGDLGQAHVKRSGFGEFIRRIEEFDAEVAQIDQPLDWQLEKSPVCRFTRDDIVRSGLTRKMVEIFY